MLLEGGEKGIVVQPGGIFRAELIIFALILTAAETFISQTQDRKLPRITAG